MNSSLFVCKTFFLRRLLWLALALGYCSLAAAQLTFSVVCFAALHLGLKKLEATTWTLQVETEKRKGNLKAMSSAEAELAGQYRLTFKADPYDLSAEAPRRRPR